MIKKIILGISILFSTSLVAQEATASPYSFYGIGDVKFKGTNENRAMGGVGVIADSIHVNLQNPATYALLKYTSLSLGGSNVRTTFKTDSQTEKAQRTTLDYLAVGVPFGKGGFSFGLIPYTAVGYKVQNNITTPDDKRTQFYKGEGGVNKVFLGGAYKITSKLSVGLDMQYAFGGIETTSIVFITDPWVLLGSRTRNESTYSGFSMNTGLFYQTKLKNKYDWYNSFTFTPKSNLNSSNIRSVAVVTYNVAGVEFISGNGEQKIDVPDSKLKMPSKVSFGSAIGKSKNWFVGTELTFQGKNDLGNQGNLPNVTFENGAKFSLGGYYIPKYNSFRSYFERIVYRAGFHHEKTGLVINDKSINQTGVNFGLGLPVGSSISNINIGFEFGKRGTTSNGLIQENYFGLNIGLSFSDRWFIRPKYD